MISDVENRLRLIKQTGYIIVSNSYDWNIPHIKHLKI